MSWDKLYAQAADQHLVLGRDDGLRFEISRRRLERRAAQEGWDPLFDGSAWALPGAKGGLRRKAMAVSAIVGSAGTPAAPGATGGRAADVRPAQLVLLTGLAGLHLHGAWPHEPARLDWLILNHRREPKIASPTVRFIRCRRIELEDLDGVDALPVAAPARCLRDAAAELSPETLLGIAVDLVRLGKMSVGDLDALLARDATFMGRPKLVAVAADLRRFAADSGWEWIVQDALSAAGFEPWPAPFPWLAPDGRLNHLDVALPASWVYVDCIGDRVHTDRETAQADRRRWNAAAGIWSCVWAGWERRDDITGIVRDVSRHVDSADPARPPAVPEPCGCARCAQLRPPKT